MQVAHSWAVFGFWWLLAQDGAGGFEWFGTAYQVTGDIADIDDLEKVLASRFLRFFIRKCHDNESESFLVSNMCGEFMLCGHCECGQTNPQQSCLWCEVISYPWVRPSYYGMEIYKLEASLFCVANPLQVNTELATEIVLRLSGPLCLLSEPFSTQDGKWTRQDADALLPRGTSKSSPQCFLVQVSKCFKCFKSI